MIILVRTEAPFGKAVVINHHGDVRFPSGFEAGGHELDFVATTAAVSARRRVSELFRDCMDEPEKVIGLVRRQRTEKVSKR